jgi:hypothetical protein|nr:hypothetical protein [Neorhizobium tomejilense]
MSSAFHTTIGWGMPWFEFEALTTLDCEAHDTRNSLEKAFNGSPPDVFEIDDSEYEAAFNRAPRAVYLTTNPLHCNILVHNGDKFILGEPSELFQVINASEDGSGDHVVFYPDCYHARLWQRVDDDIDLALHYYGGSRDAEIDNGAHVKYVGFGHGAWKTSLMTEEGRPHEWLPFHELRKRLDIVPRVPLEMRWFLSRLGILDDNGINKLRPLVARWISY